MIDIDYYNAPTLIDHVCSYTSIDKNLLYKYYNNDPNFYLKRRIPITREPSIGLIIASLFSWSKTDEGNDYWNDIFNLYSNKYIKIDNIIPNREYLKLVIENL